MQYKDYLQSAHWKTIAEETKRLAGYRCQVCNSVEELHAHHRTYERKGDELQSDLICLCSNCHSIFHDKNRDVKIRWAARVILFFIFKDEDIEIRRLEISRLSEVFGKDIVDMCYTQLVEQGRITRK